ncbi:hypothetical protein, partial [Sharpea azabuensis]|uniref:hypothetical protein n=1 Tax=Sharpea azabuensis TaxID=322505 RepID=UPI001EE75AFC
TRSSSNAQIMYCCFCSVLFLAMPHQLLHAYIIPYMKYHLDISILHIKKDCPQSFDCQQSVA